MQSVQRCLGHRIKERRTRRSSSWNGNGNGKWCCKVRWREYANINQFIINWMFCSVFQAYRQFLVLFVCKVNAKWTWSIFNLPASCLSRFIFPFSFFLFLSLTYAAINIIRENQAGSVRQVKWRDKVNQKWKLSGASGASGKSGATGAQSGGQMINAQKFTSIKIRTSFLIKDGGRRILG